MTDNYTRFVSRGLGQDLAKRLGLPQPVILQALPAGRAPGGGPRPGPGLHRRRRRTRRGPPGLGPGRPPPRRAQREARRHHPGPRRAGTPGRSRGPGPDGCRLAAGPGAERPRYQPVPDHCERSGSGRSRGTPGRGRAAAVVGQGTARRLHRQRHPARRGREDHQPERPGGAAVLPFRPFGLRGRAVPHGQLRRRPVAGRRR